MCSLNLSTQCVSYFGFVHPWLRTINNEVSSLHQVCCSLGNHKPEHKVLLKSLMSKHKVGLHKDCMCKHNTRATQTKPRGSNLCTVLCTILYIKSKYAGKAQKHIGFYLNSLFLVCFSSYLCCFFCPWLFTARKPSLIHLRNSCSEMRTTLVNRLFDSECINRNKLKH